MTGPNPPDPTAVTIRAGKQHLIVAAAEHGFRDPRVIWDHPDNAALKKARVNHNTLAPGDVVRLPNLEPETAKKPVDAVSQFVVSAVGALLNVKVQDSDGQAFAKRAFLLTTGELEAPAPTVPSGALKEITPRPGETGGAGEIGLPVSPKVSEGELRIQQSEEPASPVEVTFRLLVGHLEPPNTLRGQQARLNNLGYFAGFTANDVDQLRWAIEEFQHDHGIKPNGKTDDPTTFNKIAHVHGDLLASEKVP